MRNLLSLGLAALLSACALQPAPVYEPSTSSVYSQGAPLRARLLNSGGRLMVQTSRPAYVAIFEIVPGRGVGLLYPAYYGEDNFLSSGLNTIWISRSRRYYDYFTAYVGRDQSPRYLYMIASDAPLKLSQFIDSPGALRRTLGLRTYASSSPYSLMDQLSSMVLPYGASGEWADDVLTIFPDRSYDTETYAASQWVRVQCPDGRVIEGPIFYAYGACDSRGSQVPPRLDNPVQKPPAQPGDTSKVQEPTRRRPVEPQPVGTGGTRITARPPNIETIPEPGSDGRIRPIPAIPAEAGRDEPRTDAPRRLDPRDDERTRRTDPPEERRSEPGIERSEPRVERSEPRPEPRVERSEPRPEPRVERSEPRPEPRSEPRVETPRVETPRVETPRVEPPREEPRSEPRSESRPEPRPSEPPSR